ncbi:hypothetical protein [Streptomyces sp. NRRL F-5702]|uniref:hypothetical protein n=1 Tax=Streptomyces sp. NRRL F-5702 TaxID=1463870 RepID=UPI000516A51F|nr:hypothetical protein [Streptomyces sp. NRRL F-5702]
MAWRQHVPALASASAGIKQAEDAWDAVSDYFCDHDGWPVDEKGYADGKVVRDAQAWKHVEVFLAHGPEVLAGVRAAATGADYLGGPISEDLRRLTSIDAALKRAGQIQREWDDVMTIMDGSLPGTRALYEGRAQEIRNAEGWHDAHELSLHGPALVRAAEYVTSRPEPEQPSQTERARVALKRSASGTCTAPPTPPPVPPASPTPPHRSR